jgi:aspartate carbamoyltransferase catalytic subunit
MAAGQIVRERRDLSEVAALQDNYCDLAVVGSTDPGLLRALLDYARVPMINAGDGDDEAPTQALTDLYMLLKWRPDLIGTDVPTEKRLQIGIFGNPANTDTIRSLLFGLALFPHMVRRIVLLERLALTFPEGEREALEASGLEINTITELCPQETVMGSFAQVVPELDVIYSHLKLQQAVSRMNMLDFKSYFKPNLLLLSPRRQVPEFSTLINDSPHNGFFAQARSGVFVRRAVMSAVMA